MSIEKIRGLVECKKKSLRGKHRETVDYLLAGCKKLLGTKYFDRHKNTLNV